MASNFLHKLRTFEDRLAGVAGPILLLLLRLVFGYGMLRAGWNKLANLDGVTQFFASLGIPVPGATAALVGGLEFAAGILLLPGLLTRLAAAVLLPVMLVALATAHGGEVAQFFDNPGVTIATPPMPFVAALIAFLVGGSGAFSLDRLISGRK